MQINHSLESLLSKRESTIVSPTKLWRENVAFIIEDHVFEKERLLQGAKYPAVLHDKGNISTLLYKEIIF